MLRAQILSENLLLLPDFMGWGSPGSTLRKA
jgi:hypothetical protein